MKRLFMNLCLGITLLGISACEGMSMGDVDTAPPYAHERTATHTETPRAPEPAPVVMAEPAPRSAPMTEKSCSCDCSSWENRALRAESELAQCREGSKRVRDAHDELLRK